MLLNYMLDPPIHFIDDLVQFFISVKDFIVDELAIGFLFGGGRVSEEVLLAHFNQ